MSNDELSNTTADELINILHSLNSNTHKILYYGPQPLAQLTAGLKTVHAIPAAFTLTGSPVGGTWSGVGITPGGLFNPQTAGAGPFTFMYHFTSGASTCSDSASARMTPCAVMRPLTKRAGVTSKAGFAATVPSGARRTSRTWPAAARSPNYRTTQCRRIGCAGNTSSASTRCATATSRKPRAGSTCTAAHCSASWPSARRADFVGWAKRSVPTIRTTVADRWWARRKVRLCPPYGTTEFLETRHPHVD